ncbi:unnamed protein product [Clonostachys chloroleuca]|uniref:Uncharacterized protein n=1 Tax=Clonostachys chloroleuca TaxID=1926264 RepID=A0AA35QAY3_9HYPO|nr:unnamed protein product [Clonostachys chloroleuca]
MSSQAADASSERFRNHKPISKLVPAYLPQVGSPLVVDNDLYAAMQQAFRVLVKEFTLSIRPGRARPQYLEQAQPARAVLGQPHGSHLSTSDRLWFSLPARWRRTAWVSAASRVHEAAGDELPTPTSRPCSPDGAQYGFHYQSNPVRTVMPRGLRETGVRDIVKTLQSTGLDKERI